MAGYIAAQLRRRELTKIAKLQMAHKSLFMVFVVQVLILLAGVEVLSSRILLPYSHVVLSGLLIFLCVMSVMFSEKESTAPLVSIIIAGLFFRGIYTFAMGPNVIPLSDSYTDYAYTAVSLSNGRIDIFTGEGGILNLEAVSQWPLLHTFTAELVQIAGLDLTLSVSYIVPTIIWLISTVLVYLFVKYILTHLGLGKRVALMVTLLYVLLPHQIYETIQFIRGSFGLLWIYFLLYLVIRSFFKERPSKSDAILLVIFSASLAISHHYSSLLLLFFILIAWACSNLTSLKNLLSGITMPILKKTPFNSIMRIFPVVLLSWWLFYGTLAFMFGRNLLSLFYPIERGYTRQLEGSVFLMELRPPDVSTIVVVRDVIVYGFIAAGILYFLFIFVKAFKMKGLKREYMLVFSSLVAVCLTFILAALLVGVPDKVIAFFAPVLLLCSGLCINKLDKKKPLRILLVLTITVAGIGVGLAPYSHNYAPLYLYDNSIRPEETNTHNPNYWRVTSFLNAYVPNSTYVSDDGRLLYAVLSFRDFKQISSFGLSSDYGDFYNGTMVVRFGNYPSDHDFWTIAEMQADKIYSSELPEVWIKK